MKILVIHSNQHPINSPGSRRLDSFLDHLSVNNEITLLSHHSVDSLTSASSYERVTVKVPLICFNPFYKRVNGLFRRYVPELDKYLSFSSKLLNRALTLLKSNKYDLIFSTYQPITSVWVASKAAKLSQTLWVCDLRDIPNQFLDVGKQNRESKYLSKLLEQAISATTVNDFLRDRLLNEYPVKDVGVIYNGVKSCYLVTGFASLRKESTCQNYFNLVYAGSLYAGRSLDYLMEAIENILVLHPELEKLIKVTVLGSITLSQKEYYQKRYRLKIDFAGMLNQEDLYSYYKNSYALINLLPSTHRHAIPSKIFEYASTGRHILNLSPIDTFVSDFIKNNNFGTTVKAVCECERWLIKHISYWEVSRDILPLNQNYKALEYFTRELQAEKLEEFIMRSVCAKTY